MGIDIYTAYNITRMQTFCQKSTRMNQTHLKIVVKLEHQNMCLFPNLIFHNFFDLSFSGNFKETKLGKLPTITQFWRSNSVADSIVGITLQFYNDQTIYLFCFFQTLFAPFLVFCVRDPPIVKWVIIFKQKICFGFLRKEHTILFVGFPRVGSSYCRK